MASKTLMHTKDGRAFYKLRYQAGRNQPEKSMRWYVPEGWSKKAIDRELRKVESEFEQKCNDGEILTRKQAEAIAEAERAKEEATMTVEQYGQQIFMARKALDCAENTRAYYQVILTKHIYSAIGKKKMPTITAAMLNKLITSYQVSGASHSSVIGMYTTLQQLFKSAYMNDVIERNPMDKVIKPRKTKEKLKNETKEAYTAEEIQYIKSCLKDEPLKWQAYIGLLIDSGCRKAEACGLQWEYVDFKNNQITIAHNLLYTVEKGIYLDTPKTGKQRTIGIDPSVMEMLKQIRSQQVRDGYISKFVFTQDHATVPMHPQTPDRWCQRFAKRNGIENFHPHKLRHTQATIALIYGADIASVSAKLGHSRISTTLDMYTHPTLEGIEKASETFRNAINAEVKQA